MLPTTLSAKKQTGSSFLAKFSANDVPIKVPFLTKSTQTVALWTVLVSIWHEFFLCLMTYLLTSVFWLQAKVHTLSDTHRDKSLIIDLILSLRRQRKNKALSQMTKSHYRLNSLILMLALQVKTSRSFERDGNRLLHRHTLNELSEGGDSKARGLHLFILKWDFVITTVILQHLFECTHRSSLYHQVNIATLLPFLITW